MDILPALLGAALLVIALLLARYGAYQHRARADAAHNALQQLEQWRQRDLLQVRDQQLQLARADALVQLEGWKLAAEQAIRQDAVRKSQGVTLGKVTEHFIPYLPAFKFNPRDARFIGSPIDFVVFNGLDSGEVDSILFVEIKTGKGALSTRERRIRDAVEAGRVHWLELRQFETNA